MNVPCTVVGIHDLWSSSSIATNVLKLRKNSSGSKVDSKSKYMPRVRLHAYKAKYDFLNDSRVVRYLIGPAKSTPITSNKVFPWVLVVGRLPGGGVEYAFALTRLLSSCRSLGLALQLNKNRLIHAPTYRTFQRSCFFSSSSNSSSTRSTAVLMTSFII